MPKFKIMLFISISLSIRRRRIIVMTFPEGRVTFPVWPKINKEKFISKVIGVYNEVTIGLQQYNKVTIGLQPKSKFQKNRSIIPTGDYLFWYLYIHKEYILIKLLNIIYSSF